jgi:hypothetical protein
MQRQQLLPHFRFMIILAKPLLSDQILLLTFKVQKYVSKDLKNNS